MTHYWLTFLHVDWPLACFISSLNVWTPFAYMPCPLSHPQMALAESLLLTQNKEDAIRLPGNATTRVHVVSCVVGFPFLNGIVHPCTDITTCRWHYGQDQSPSCEAFQFQKQTNKKKAVLTRDAPSLWIQNASPCTCRSALELLRFLIGSLMLRPVWPT